MSVNDFKIEQGYAFINAVQAEQLGANATIQAVDAATFTSVATNLLKSGYDDVIGAISKVLAKTVMSVRPYTAAFKGIEADAERFGLHTRRINFGAMTAETDERLNLTDGSSVDPWKVKKAPVYQTNIYGSYTFQNHVTIFRNQLDAAMTGPGEWAAFVDGLLISVQNDLEQWKEARSRGTLINFILGKVKCDAGNCINVLQEYKNETGVALTVANMFSDDKYVPFVKWLYAFINTETDLLKSRSEKFHFNATGHKLPRHTPAANLKAYMSSKVANKIDSVVLSSIFNPEKLKAIDFENVPFWQSINEPLAVKGKASYMAANGGITVDTADHTVSNIMGLLFDEEALGITIKRNDTSVSPENPAGMYFNIYYHLEATTWNDFTHNAILLYAADPT